MRKEISKPKSTGRCTAALLEARLPPPAPHRRILLPRKGNSVDSVVYFSGGFCFCGLNICVFLPDFTKEFCDIRYMLYSNGGCDIHGKYADFSLAFLVSALSSEEESLCCCL